MALQKQNFQLSIVDGLDTKTDSKNVLPTRWLELENVVHTKTGSLSKRPGGTAASSNVFGGGSIASGQGLAQFKNELLQYGDNKLYSRSDAEAAWVSKGTVTQVISKTSSVFSNNSALRWPTMVAADGFVFYASAQEYNGNPVQTNYKLCDAVTGTQLASGSLNVGAFPSVEYFNGKFCLFYRDYVTSYMQVFTINPRTLATTNGLVQAIAINQCFSVRTIGQRLFITYSKVSDNSIYVTYYNTNMSLASQTLVVSPGSAPLFLNLNVEDINDVRLCWSLDQDSVGAFTICYNYELNAAYSTLPTVVFSNATGARTGKIYSVNYGSYSEIYWVNRTASPYSTTLFIAKMSKQGDFKLTPTVLMYNVLMLVEPHAVNGTTYLPVAKGYPFDIGKHNRTAFVIDSSGNMIARLFEDATILDEFNYSPSGAVFQRPLCNGPRAVILNGLLQFTLPVLDAITSSTATQFNDFTKVSLATLDFTTGQNYYDTLLGGNLHITGSIMKMYDGQAVYEHGFVDPPDTLTNSISNLGPPAPGAGKYFYVAVYAWKDAQGQLHRSRPSNQLTVDLTTNQYATIQVPTTPFTLKSNVEVEVYRSSAAQPTFLKLTGTSGYANVTYNNPQMNTVLIIDQQTDSQIASNEALYTTGGTLENTVAGASSLPVLWRNRVVVLASDGKSVQYSKLRALNGPVEWAAELVITLDDIGGLGTSLGVLDDNLVIFKQRAIQFLSGQGPDNTGTNDDFGRPSLVTADTGVLDPASVVQMPLGLMFKSEKGIYLLARGLQVAYIGSGVEAYNGLTITSSTLRTNTNEVLFTTASGRTLVYDYFHSRWTTFTNQFAEDSLIKDSKLHYIRPNGQVLIEDGLFADNGSPVNSRLTTAWLSLSGIQGFQRCYRLLILGNFKDSHKLRVRIAYDYVDQYVHEELIDATAVLATTDYGAGNYGDANYGGDYPLYQFQIDPKIQKCQAIKFCIEDVCPSGGSEGFTISNLAMEVGVEGGLNRIKAGRKFGAS